MRYGHRGVYRARPARPVHNARKRRNPSSGRAALLTKSKVKDLVKSIDSDMRIGGEALEGLGERLEEMVRYAIKRAKAGKRKTLKAMDF